MEDKKIRPQDKWIRICPDWNVKRILNTIGKPAEDIRICPDWNVKYGDFLTVNVHTELEYVQIGM